MASITAVIGANAVQFNQALDQAVTKARVSGASIMKSLNPSKSTISNAIAPKSERDDYAGWWAREMAAKEASAAAALRKGAIERNEHSAWMRQHSARQMAFQQEIYASSALGQLSAGFSAFTPAAAVGAVAGAAMGLSSSAKAAIEYADNIDDLSKRLGVGTEDLQRWDYALQQNGASLDKGVAFFQKLAISKTEAFRGDDKKLASFKEFGITAAQLSTMSVTDIARAISDAMAKAPDPTALFSSMRDIGGKSAMELVAAMRSGLSETMDRAFVISDDDVKKLSEFNDLLAELKTNGKVLMADMLAPAAGHWINLGRAINGTRDAASAFAESMTSGKSGFQAIKDAGAGFMRTAFGVGTGDAAAVGSQATISAEFDQQDPKEAARRSDSIRAKLSAVFDERAKKAEEIARKREKHELLGLTDEEKLSKLEERRAALVEKQRTAKGAVERLDAEGAIYDLDETIFSLRSAAKNKRGMQRPTMDVNSLQRIGAYASAPDAAISSNVERSTGHLEKIEAGISELNKRVGSNGTKF